jgi:hypothetical protein
VLAIGLVVTGCTTMSPDVRVAVACQSYASALGALSNHKDEMSLEHVYTIDVVRSQVNPVCFEHEFDSYQDGLLIVADGLEKLAEIQEDVEYQKEQNQ